MSLRSAHFEADVQQWNAASKQSMYRRGEVAGRQEQGIGMSGLRPACTQIYSSCGGAASKSDRFAAVEKTHRFTVLVLRFISVYVFI
jgi:hypothetical protein